jgi:hypothetical protein
MAGKRTRAKQQAKPVAGPGVSNRICSPDSPRGDRPSPVHAILRSAQRDALAVRHAVELARLARSRPLPQLTCSKRPSATLTRSHSGPATTLSRPRPPLMRSLPWWPHRMSALAPADTRSVPLSPTRLSRPPARPTHQAPVPQRDSRSKPAQVRGADPRRLGDSWPVRRPVARRCHAGAPSRSAITALDWSAATRRRRATPVAATRPRARAMTGARWPVSNGTRRRRGSLTSARIRGIGAGVECYMTLREV